MRVSVIELVNVILHAAFPNTNLQRFGPLASHRLPSGHCHLCPISDGAQLCGLAPRLVPNHETMSLTGVLEKGTRKWQVVWALFTRDESLEQGPGKGGSCD